MVQNVLILGIDGMDPKLVEKMFDQGKLPHFKSLTYRKLSTTMTPQSPTAWATLGTGMNPGKTNIFDFIRRDPKNYLPILSLAKTKSTLAGTNYESFVKGEPFWKITSDKGIPTSIIRWPLTFPAEKVGGNLLSGLGVPDVKGFLSGYTYYAETEEVIGENKTITVKKDKTLIRTVIKGPRKQTAKGIADIEIPFEIKIGNTALLRVNEKEYGVKEGEWTPWIDLEFKVGAFKKMSAITKGYVQSIKPFKMYLSDVQIDPRKPAWKISYPKNYAKELSEEIGLFHTLGMAEDTAAYEDDAINREIFLEQIKIIEEERNNIFWSEFQNWQEKGGIYAFVYDESDRLQHMFYGQDNSVIESYYEQKDLLLGEILDKLDGDEKLLVLSDHGITTYNRNVELNAWLVKEGYLVLDKNENKPLFANVDWSKSKAYSVGFSGIYINKQNREGQGIVEEDDCDDLIEEIIGKLKNLKDGDKKIVINALRATDIFNGPYVGDAPDIIVGFDEGYRAGWDSPIGGTPSEFITNNKRKWKADHIVDASLVPGCLFTNFPVKKVFAENVDVAPTILDIVSIEVPKNMDGKSLL